MHRVTSGQILEISQADIERYNAKTITLNRDAPFARADIFKWFKTDRENNPIPSSSKPKKGVEAPEEVVEEPPAKVVEAPEKEECLAVPCSKPGKMKDVDWV